MVFLLTTKSSKLLKSIELLSKKTILETENKYKTMMDNVDYIKEYSYNLNKVFVLIGELRNAIELEELELTNIKYVNFIEKI